MSPCQDNALGRPGDSFLQFPFLFARSAFFLHIWIGKQGMCRNFSVASLRVVSVIYSAELTGPRIYAISVLTGPYRVFSNYLGDWSHHPF